MIRRFLARRRLARITIPDPVYRERSMAQLSPERRDKRNELRALLADPIVREMGR